MSSIIATLLEVSSYYTSGIVATTAGETTANNQMYSEAATCSCIRVAQGSSGTVFLVVLC